MSAIEVIKTRRSIRSFNNKAIEDDVIEEILDMARVSPSGGNRQRWKFIYIKDSNILRMVKGCCPGFYGDAGGAIIAGLENEADTLKTRSNSTIGLLDIGFATENILLAAHALGLGGCAIASFNSSCISKIIDSPENFIPVLVISIGYPDIQPTMPPKKKLSDIVYINSWGKKWRRLENRE
jgi:nitroreductase